MCVVANPASTSTITDTTYRQIIARKGKRGHPSRCNHGEVVTTIISDYHQLHIYVVRRPTTFSMASTIGHQKGSFFLFPFCEVKDYKGLCYVSFYQTLSTSSKTAISDPPLRPRRLQARRSKIYILRRSTLHTVFTSPTQINNNNNSSPSKGLKHAPSS